MMTMKQFSKVCTKAADLIVNDGFQKGGFGTKDGPKCAIGALRYAAHGDTDHRLDLDDADTLADLFRAARPRSKRDNVVSFNDAPRTRKHDVVELLRDMADIARRL